MVLKFYQNPPSQNAPIQLYGRIESDEYFGPVHDFEQTMRFTTVLVPRHVDSTSRDLAWVNVWSMGIDYAFHRDVSDWERRGWTNVFVPMQPEPGEVVREIQQSF